MVHKHTKNFESHVKASLREQEFIYTFVAVFVCLLIMPTNVPFHQKQLTLSRYEKFEFICTPYIHYTYVRVL